jgi:hypothetical protein
VIGEKTRRKRDHWEYQDVGGHTILRSILGQIGQGGKNWSGSGKRSVAGSCEYGNEPSNSIKCWEVLK